MRLIVARCQVSYAGRLTASLPDATRLVMLKADGSVLIHADAGGYKPLNWMTGPCLVEETADTLTVRKWIGKTEEILEIRLIQVLTDFSHELGEDAGLEKDGVERHLQEALADAPHVLADGLRLVRREWPTDIGPVDLMCRDTDNGWVAVEVKRIAGIEAVEQLTRYLSRICLEPGMTKCKGMLAAQSVKPQARTLAEARGFSWIEVDLAVLRGEREPDLTLFSA